MIRPHTIPHTITHRSYKHSEDETYLNELLYVSIHVSDILNNIDDSYWFCSELLKSIIDIESICSKKRYEHVPFINCYLRKSITVRNSLKRNLINIKITKYGTLSKTGIL